jgi:uncharacterized protein (DUF1778 family)
LTTLEWASNPGSIKLSPEEFDRLVEFMNDSPRPSESLEKAAAEHERRLAVRALTAGEPSGR